MDNALHTSFNFLLGGFVKLVLHDILLCQTFSYLFRVVHAIHSCLCSCTAKYLFFVLGHHSISAVVVPRICKLASFDLNRWVCGAPARHRTNCGPNSFFVVLEPINVKAPYHLPPAMTFGE